MYHISDTFHSPSIGKIVSELIYVLFFKNKLHALFILSHCFCVHCKREIPETYKEICTVALHCFKNVKLEYKPHHQYLSNYLLNMS